MTSKRWIEGDIFSLRCESCSTVFPHIIFSGDTDAATDGLVSLSSFVEETLAITEVTGDEWPDYARGELTGVAARMSQALGRDDLKLVQVLRWERQDPPRGTSFQAFRAAYQPPVGVYGCIRCSEGECRAAAELSPDQFVQLGGRIVTVGDLEFRA